MELNHKQKKLIDNFLATAKNKFPELEFVRLWTNPDDDDHILIDVIADMDEERYYSFQDFETEIEIEIDNNYGYRITMLLENTHPEFA